MLFLASGSTSTPAAINIATTTFLKVQVFPFQNSTRFYCSLILHYISSIYLLSPACLAPKNTAHPFLCHPPRTHLPRNYLYSLPLEYTWAYGKEVVNGEEVHNQSQSVARPPSHHLLIRQSISCFNREHLLLLFINNSTESIQSQLENGKNYSTFAIGCIADWGEGI